MVSEEGDTEEKTIPKILEMFSGKKIFCKILLELFICFVSDVLLLT